MCSSDKSYRVPHLEHTPLKTVLNVTDYFLIKVSKATIIKYNLKLNISPTITVKIIAEKVAICVIE